MNSNGRSFQLAGLWIGTMGASGALLSGFIVLLYGWMAPETAGPFFSLMIILFGAIGIFMMVYPLIRPSYQTEAKPDIQPIETLKSLHTINFEDIKPHVVKLIGSGAYEYSLNERQYKFIINGVGYTYSQSFLQQQNIIK